MIFTSRNIREVPMYATCDELIPLEPCVKRYRFPWVKFLPIWLTHEYTPFAVDTQVFVSVNDKMNFTKSFTAYWGHFSYHLS